jgi:hypothetical protein
VAASAPAATGQEKYGKKETEVVKCRPKE